MGRNHQLTEKVFRALFVARERGMTVRELVDEVYAHDANGGALWANDNVRKSVYYLKKRLAPLGATITSDWGPGSRYRLEML